MSISGEGGTPIGGTPITRVCASSSSSTVCVCASFFDNRARLGHRTPPKFLQSHRLASVERNVCDRRVRTLSTMPDDGGDTVMRLCPDLYDDKEALSAAQVGRLIDDTANGKGGAIEKKEWIDSHGPWLSFEEVTAGQASGLCFEEFSVESDAAQALERERLERATLQRSGAVDLVDYANQARTAADPGGASSGGGGLAASTGEAAGSSGSSFFPIVFTIDVRPGLRSLFKQQLLAVEKLSDADADKEAARLAKEVRVQGRTVVVWFWERGLEVRILVRDLVVEALTKARATADAATAYGDVEIPNLYYRAKELWGHIHPDECCWVLNKTRNKIKLKLRKQHGGRSMDKWAKFRRL